jgi:hypothetical protein
MGKFTKHPKSGKKLLYASLLVPLGWCVGCSGASQDPISHITISRETLYESGFGVDPSAIAPTHDGGLLVAGKLIGHGWATRIGPTGAVAWRYPFPRPSASEIQGNSSYAGVVQLPDDSTLLCGVSKVRNNMTGLLTHISAAGDLIGHELLDPQDDDSFGRSDIRFCEPYGNGAVAVGFGFPTIEDQTRGTPSLRIEFVDAQARRSGDHFLKVRPGNILIDVFSDAHDVILVLIGGTRDANGKKVVATHLLRVDGSGSIKADRAVIGGGFYLRPTTPQNSSISLFLEPDGKSQLKQLNSAFDEVSVTNGPDANFFPTRSFITGDGSTVICGNSQYHRENSFSASITWVSPTLRERQVLMFSPTFAAFKVGAAMPSGAGEFIAVRGVQHGVVPVPGSEKDDPTGLMVTVFKIQ